jgi:hypothetical protein
MRFERLLRSRRDKLAKENPFLTKDVRPRFDEDLEVVRRYTHSLNAEAQVALAVRDAFDCANNSYPEHHKIPTSLKDDGPLIALTRAALEYTPIKDKTPQIARKVAGFTPAMNKVCELLLRACKTVGCVSFSRQSRRQLCEPRLRKQPGT